MDNPRVVTLKDFYEQSERSKRISVDVDEGTLRTVRVFYLLQALFPKSKVTVEKTLHGFHVKAVGDEIREVPVEKRLELREKLGDDPLRIECDRRKLLEGRPYTVDTLFSLKCNFKGEWSIVQPENLRAAPFCSRLPADKKKKHLNISS